MNDFIITSILGLIFLGIGLAIRFKIRSDNKKGIFHKDTFNGKGFREKRNHGGIGLGLSNDLKNRHMF
ncbi:MAG: hypothetical protein M1412_08715 [Deltaproteobacteria bacterium]|nr:hypothetical protein [Deltaproteobacteria bacterium]MCL5893225.1 hypothetical protein [Deltaproteobacteria bacterium]